MSVPKFPKIALETPEHPKIGKHSIHNIYERFMQNCAVSKQNLSENRNTNVFRPKISRGKMSGMTSFFEK